MPKEDKKTKGQIKGIKRKELKSIINDLTIRLGNLKSEFKVQKQRELDWREQFDNEVYYKNMFRKNLDEANKRIETLQDALDALGNGGGNCVGTQGVDLPTKWISGKGGYPEEVVDDEAVEWAKRNGHHFPEGRPEKDRMELVEIKTADKISEENRIKTLELLKEYHKVPIDPNFDEKSKANQSLD